ncbi:MAG: RNA 2',3'-cyclic phosphodiesterase [Patescibacteria group bacterium]|nr:RNA 2',3'-cyclic phosphodiesterase [Patescibacteria group bacterium]
MRIFIAINLPEGIKRELENLEKEIAALFPEELRGTMIKWVKKENLHLTLLFIGSVPDPAIPKISQIIKEIAQKQPSFSLKFNKLSYGPPRIIPPRLIWLDLERKKELLELAEKLKKEMKIAGILRKAEQREFSPHITLARIRTWQWRQIAPEERPEVEREIDLNFEVKSVEVMESVLKRTGAEYFVLESIKLI